MCKKLSQIMRFPMRPISYIVYVVRIQISQFEQISPLVPLTPVKSLANASHQSFCMAACKLSSKQSRMVTIPGFPILPHPNVSRLTSHDCASPCLSEIDSPIMVPGDRLNFFRIFSAKPPAIPPYPAAPPYLNVFPSNRLGPLLSECFPTSSSCPYLVKSARTHLTRVDSPIMHQAVQ